MKDLYLRFKDTKEMKETLVTFGFINDEEQGGLYHPEVCLDIIGIITVTKEEPSENGEEVPEGEEVITYTAEPGYHANIRVLNDELDLTVLEKFAINPKTPARVWA